MLCRNDFVFNWMDGHLLLSEDMGIKESLSFGIEGFVVCNLLEYNLLWICFEYQKTFVFCDTNIREILSPTKENDKFFNIDCQCVV